MDANEPGGKGAGMQDEDGDDPSLWAQRPLEIAAAIGALLVLGILFAGFE
jgi:hypothetical protein